MLHDPAIRRAIDGRGRPVTVMGTGPRFHINGPAIVEVDFELGGQITGHRVRNLATSVSFAAEPGWLHPPENTDANVVFLATFRKKG